jgi:hypothetical protein
MAVAFGVNGEPYRAARPAQTVPRTNRRRLVARISTFVSVACFVVGGCLWYASSAGAAGDLEKAVYFTLFGIAGVQAACGLTGAVATLMMGLRARRQKVPFPARLVLSGVMSSLLGVAGVFGLPLFWFLATFHLDFHFAPGSFDGGGWDLGGAWGRPLRVDGKILNPDLIAGDAWTGDDTPAVEGLSPATRDVLAMFWLHDAKKEHASVPAFARLAWVLVGLGAPADLVERSHLAALEEIDHTRRCFALAAAYAGASLQPRPMPRLLGQNLRLDGDDPLVTLATESLVDGCLLEEYNADLAEVALANARDPAVREVARRIARDERGHGLLAWDMLAWAIAAGGERVVRALERTAAAFDPLAPLPYGDELASFVAEADATALLVHGRVPVGACQPIYTARVQATRARIIATLRRAELLPALPVATPCVSPRSGSSSSRSLSS